MWDIDSLNLKLQELSKLDHKMRKKIVPYLLKVLKNNEKILFHAKGLMDTPTDAVGYLITCTDRRIIILSEDNSYKRTIGINKIKSVNCISGWTESKMTIKSDNETIKFMSMYKDSAEILNFTINELKAHYEASLKSVGGDSLDKLKRLKNLVNTQAITQEEFDIKKEKLMKQI